MSPRDGYPRSTLRRTPLSHSFCQYVVASGEPLLIDDARRHPLVSESLAIADLGVVAYAGVPLRTLEGAVLGALCAIDHAPRRWRRREVAILRALADAVMTDIELRLCR